MKNNLNKQVGRNGADLSNFEEEWTQWPANSNPVGGPGLPGTA